MNGGNTEASIVVASNSSSQFAAAREQNVGARASGSGWQPVLSIMGEPKVHTLVGEDIEDVKKIVFMPQKTEQIRKLSMDPMVESSWKSKNYSAPAEESI